MNLNDAPISGETMKKYGISVTIILIASALILGCVTPTPTAVPTDGTPTVLPTQAPVPTPTPKATLTPYDTEKPQHQYMKNGILVWHPRTFRADDWMLPIAQPGKDTSTHGVVQELIFENPTIYNQTVSSWNIKSLFNYKIDGVTGFLLSYNMFYDDYRGFYSEITLLPGEHRKVNMYSYIVGDREYEKYKGFINTQVDISPQ